MVKSTNMTGNVLHITFLIRNAIRRKRLSILRRVCVKDVFRKYMSDGTTSLSELPTHGSDNNFHLGVKEVQQIEEHKLDENTINQIVDGIGKSKVSFELPTRDIPMNSVSHTNDQQVQPNYIPKVGQQTHYIDDEIDIGRYATNQQKLQHHASNVNAIYDEIQFPVLISLLYFLFQLPAFRKMLFRNMTFLYLKDGNMNLTGFMFVSSLFGLCFYILQLACKIE